MVATGSTNAVFDTGKKRKEALMSVCEIVMIIMNKMPKHKQAVPVGNANSVIQKLAMTTKMMPLNNVWIIPPQNIKLKNPYFWIIDLVSRSATQAEMVLKVINI